MLPTLHSLLAWRGLITASIKCYKTGKGKRRWKATVYIGVDPKTGRKKYAVKGGKATRQEAISAGKELEQAVQNGELTAAPKAVNVKHKFKDVCLDWLEAYQLTVRESSWSKTRDCFNLHILPELGDMYVDQITAHDLQEAVEKWYKQSPTKFKRYFRHVKRVLNYAEMQDYIPNQRQVVLPSLLH